MVLQQIPRVLLELRAEKEKGRRDLLRRLRETLEQERAKIDVVFARTHEKWLKKLGEDQGNDQIQRAIINERKRLSAGIDYLNKGRE